MLRMQSVMIFDMIEKNLTGITFLKEEAKE